MAIDPYAPCPCGSGKKFKWCCQPFYSQIEKAFTQNANNQRDAALRLMEQLTQQYPDNAEVWGRRAELLWENNQLDEAEQAIDKALAINPNYAFGHYLRGAFRHNEGECGGALVLYRKAMEACSVEQQILLADIALSAAQCHILQQRPLAAHASVEIARRFAPQDENIQRLLTEYFGDSGPYPRLARREYPLKPPAAATTPQRRQAWERALSGHTTGKLTDALQAFEELTSADETDAPAWYNLGLIRAWLGDNLPAIDAFDRYVTLESDEEQAASAWALAEVMRFGAEMESASDYLQYEARYTIRDFQTVGQILQREKRLVEAHQLTQGVGGTLLDREMPAVRDDLALFELPRVAALFVIAGDKFIFANLDEEMLAKARQVMEPQLAGTVAGPEFHSRPAAFVQLGQHLLSVRLPSGLHNEAAKRLIDGVLQQELEEKWARRPLRSLGHIAPIDAAGHAVLRRKVLGLVRFWEDVVQSFLPVPYDFDRLRHKLGLPTAQPAQVEQKRQGDVSAMNAAELAALDAASLTDTDLQTAFQTAVRLDAREVAGRFAEQGVSRPWQAGQQDRYALYTHLAQLTVDQDDFAAAQSWLDAGLKDDCEHNEGRRRNDYELRRAQVHLRAREPDAARDLFERLIERSPSNLDVLGRATEAMLSAKQHNHAAKFAEQGLTKAKERGDRDRVGYFTELLSAAKRV